MSDLAQFLLDRISEDEESARAASPGPWHLNAERDEVLAVDDITVCDGFALSGPQTRATTTHIARHDPARVLAECESKRRIVEEVAPDVDSLSNAYVDVTDEPADWPADRLLRLLALPYADHSEYDPAWRPEETPHP